MIEEPSRLIDVEAWDRGEVDAAVLNKQKNTALSL